VIAVGEAQEREERIKAQIDASQERLQRESAQLPAMPRREPLPDAYPPEDLRSLAAEHPWLTMAAGAGLGMLAGALVPKRFGAGLGKRAFALATVAAELGLALSKQSRDAAGEKAGEGLARIDEGTAPIRQRARSAGRSARSQGVKLAGEAIRIAARLRK
jgi:ElaB/YqjD/DUF883 family membrane-anchored ribosome-binding protein